jgi:hypothetical protein
MSSTLNLPKEPGSKQNLTSGQRQGVVTPCGPAGVVVILILLNMKMRCCLSTERGRKVPVMRVVLLVTF